MNVLTPVPVKATAVAGARPKGHWTEAEDAYLVAHYVEQPAPEIAGALGVPVGRIYRRAIRLGLKRGQIVYHNANVKPSTPQIDDYLRRAYRLSETRPAAARLGKIIGRSSHWVAHRAIELGLHAPRAGRPWSDEEIAVLRDNLTASAYAIQRMLRNRGFVRPPSSVFYARRRFGLMASVDGDDLLTIFQVAELFGVGHGAVRRWVKGGYLVAKRAGWDVKDKELDAYRFRRKALREFVIAHPGKINLRSLEPNKEWFIALVAGRDE